MKKNIYVTDVIPVYNGAGHDGIGSQFATIVGACECDEQTAKKHGLSKGYNSWDELYDDWPEEGVWYQVAFRETGPSGFARFEGRPLIDDVPWTGCVILS